MAEMQPTLSGIGAGYFTDRLACSLGLELDIIVTLYTLGSELDILVTVWSLVPGAGYFSYALILLKYTQKIGAGYFSYNLLSRIGVGYYSYSFVSSTRSWIF